MHKLKKKPCLINYTVLQKFRFPFCLCDLAASVVPTGLPNNVSVPFTRGRFVTEQTQWSCSLWADLNTLSVQAGSCIWHHFFVCALGCVVREMRQSLLSGGMSSPQKLRMLLETIWQPQDAAEIRGRVPNSVTARFQIDFPTSTPGRQPVVDLS